MYQSIVGSETRRRRQNDSLRLRRRRCHGNRRLRVRRPHDLLRRWQRDFDGVRLDGDGNRRTGLDRRRKNRSSAFDRHQLGLRACGRLKIEKKNSF